MTSLRTKTNEMLEAAQKMPSSEKENSVKDDALITPAPVYKQLSSFVFFLLSFFL
jgi:hypothetical protein